MSELDNILNKIDRLALRRSQLAACRVEAAKLPGLERECFELSKAVTDDLKALDVADSGNAGWEYRIVRLLSELRRVSMDAGTEIGIRKITQPMMPASNAAQVCRSTYSPPRHESQG